LPDEIGDDAIAGFARGIVGEMAPDELPLFAINSAAYFKNPKKALESRTSQDDTLGFGIEAVVPLLTPVILSVVTEVLRTLATKGLDFAGARLQAMFNRSASPVPATSRPALSAAQLAEVRKVAFEKARQLKLLEPQAALLADSVVGSLAVAS